MSGLTLDAEGTHADLGASRIRTKGHYEVCRHLAAGLELADVGTRTEVPGLTEGATRPADTFTLAALPGRSAAVDVTIVSPSAARSGANCLDAGHRGKILR